MLLSFGLGKELAVRAIIGIPTLKQWGSSITLDNNHLRCSHLKEAFSLIYEPVQNGPMSNYHFTPTNFCRPRKPHVIVLTYKLFTSTIVHPMPLEIDNSLPGILLEIGQTSYYISPNFISHIDTCASMNIGNLLLHQWIITTYPACVAEYTQFDNDNNEFHPIQLQVSINNSDTPTQSGAGILTTMVKYYPPYTSADSQSIILSFGLGDDLLVQSIIGLPTLQKWKYNIKLCGNFMICTFLKSIFSLFFERSKPCLTSGITFFASQFQLTPSTYMINNLLNHLVAITDGSHDIFAINPYWRLMPQSQYTSHRESTTTILPCSNHWRGT